jgi:transposase
MASDDPDFEAKAADIIGLYVKPPRHAAVFCVHEKTAIQALDRLDPVLPLSPGRLERHGFEYYRHGTLSLYAALNTRNGAVVGKTAARHTSQEFVAFLAELVANQPRGKEIHLIADNLSAHKTKRVEQFLAAHPKVHLHYTPTYSSWLNQVENWFAKIERDVIARGVFTSVTDLARKLKRYIRHYNRAPKPIKWTYRDPNHRIYANTTSSVTGHLAARPGGESWQRFEGSPGWIGSTTMWRMAMGTRQSEQRVRGDFAQVIKTFGNSLAERMGFEPAVPSA